MALGGSALGFQRSGRSDSQRVASSPTPRLLDAYSHLQADPHW